MLNILVLTRYGRLAASSRVRFLQFLPALEQRQMAFSVEPFFADDYVAALFSGRRTDVRTVWSAYINRLRILLSMRKYDVIWIAYEALPWLPSTIELAFLRGKPFVLDYDDAWFLRYERSPRRLIRWLMPRKIDDIMGRASVVVVGNRNLAQRADEAGARRVAIIPTVIDMDRYAAVVSPITDRKTPVVIGWIGSPLNTVYLQSLTAVFRALAAQRSIEIHIIGGSAPHSFSGLPVREIPWAEATEIDSINKFDIGIMPLEDGDWERGKCAYKLLQIMAAGRPVVASPVGANVDVVSDGINGFFADGPGQWLEALTRLIDDPGTRTRMGREALRAVKERYTMEYALPLLQAALSEAAR